MGPASEVNSGDTSKKMRRGYAIENPDGSVQLARQPPSDYDVREHVNRAMAAYEHGQRRQANYRWAMGMATVGVTGKLIDRWVFDEGRMFTKLHNKIELARQKYPHAPPPLFFEGPIISFLRFLAPKVIEDVETRLEAKWEAEAQEIERMVRARQMKEDA